MCDVRLVACGDGCNKCTIESTSGAHNPTCLSCKQGYVLSDGSCRSKYFFLCQTSLVVSAYTQILNTLRAKLSGAVYCYRSCLCVCVFATGGRAVSEPYYSQHARSVCVSLSAFFIQNSFNYLDPLSYCIKACCYWETLASNFAWTYLNTSRGRR